MTTTARIGRDLTNRPTEPRILPLALDDMTQAQRALAGIGASTVIRTLVHRDDLVTAMGPLGQALLFSERTSPRDRELAILRVALRTGAAYEWANHTLGALGAGVSEAEIRAVNDPEASWPEADAALLRTVDELCADDCVSDGTWAALRATRDDAEIIEFCLLVGYYRMMAGFLNSAGIQPEPGRPAFGEVPAAAPGTRPAPAAKGAGGTPARTWDLAFHHPSGDQDLTLVMEVRDGRITGSAANRSNGITTTVTDGTADGPRFSYTSVMTEPVRLEISCNGTVDGDSIAGDITVQGTGPFPFDGTRTHGHQPAGGRDGRK
ncbi:carboxymuconolactone decarboxylase family protein [Streptomyces sp. NPDC048644]|uniref:carboxymuconolactone decarboxylase family protein n=1 Tax=Streptomyces sp. NPDC048644 TaxID=3365582 RepID=UPI0037167FD0